MIVLLLCNVTVTATAQFNTGFNNAHYTHAVDLYEKGQYIDAELQFRQAKTANCDNEILQNIIDSYRALCLIKLRTSHSEGLVKQLDETTTVNPKQNELYFELAKQFSKAGQSKKALQWFEKTDNRELNDNDRLQCLFLQGYAYFKMKDYTKALELFDLVKRMDANAFSAPAIYYSAHINYLQKNYFSALEGFDALHNHPTYSSLADIYILQIHAYQKEYKEVIDEGTKLLESGDKKHYAEIAQLLSNAYFQTQQYAEALYYFDIYTSKQSTLSRDDFYQQALIYYNLHKYPEAAKSFNSVLLTKTDQTAQNAYYYVGDMALKAGDKEKALTNFNAAGAMKFDEIIKDASLLNAAKLSLELHRDTKPIYAYHKANPAKDVNRPLAMAYAIDKQYDKAIAALQAIANPIDKDYADIQRNAFMQAMQDFDKKAYNNAVKRFDASLAYSKYDSYLAAMTRYWKAEALYKLRDYQNASKQYEAFLHAEGAFSAANEYQLAHYNIGWCAFKMKQYTEASTWFRKFVSLSKTDTKYTADAYNHIGDCYFIQKNYALAAVNYDKTIQLKAAHVEYAIYQKAMALGLTGKPQEKIDNLNALRTKYPNSSYTPAGIYETGRTYLSLNNFDMAKKSYKTIIDAYPKNPYCQLAYMELGLIDVNTGNNKSAIENYKKAVRFNPASSEAKNALAGLKNACMEANDIESYFTFVEDLKLSPNNEDSEKEKEDSRFAIAEKTYFAGDCDETIKTFTHYLQTYPAGNYTTQANYYIGDCAFRKQRYDEAQTYFGYVTAQPHSAFTEGAMIGYARSAYQLKDYDATVAAYEDILLTDVKEKSYTLEAALRVTEAHFLSGNYSQAVDAAARALKTPDLTEQDKLKTMLWQAQSLQQTGRHDEALQHYQTLAANYIKTPEGAEAAFLAIDLLHRNSRDDEAVDAIFKMKTNQQYWSAKSYILLGDIYTERNETARAKATFKSILDGYKIQDDGIIDTVKTRLDSIE